MPSSVVRMKPAGSFGPGCRNFAITPAMKPMMMSQRMCIGALTKMCARETRRVDFSSPVTSAARLRPVAFRSQHYRIRGLGPRHVAQPSGGPSKESASMNSFGERKKVRRYRDLLRTTSDDMMRNQLCRLIAEQERRHLLQQVLDQQHTADEAETV